MTAIYIASTWQPPTPIPTPVYDAMTARPYVPLDDAGVRALAAEWLAELGQRARNARDAFVSGVNTGGAA